MSRTRQAVAREWRLGGVTLGGSTIGWNLVGVLGALLGVAIVAAWVLESYFRVDVAASISALGTDTYCDLGRSGIGVHCFGDYSSIYYPSLFGVPTAPEAVYPVSTRLVRLPFFLIATVGGFQAGLVAFVVASATCLLAPLIWAVRRSPWFAKALVVVVVGVGSGPFLYAWDRGNVLALTVPLMLAFLVGLVTNRPWLAVGAIIACATVRPQFAGLAIALVGVRAWRPALVAAFGSVTAVLAPFLLFGSRWLSGIADWVAAASAWAGSQSLEDPWPSNVSVARALFVATGISSAACAIAALGLLLVLGVAVVATARRLPPLALGASVLAITCLSLPITYGYYYVFAIPLVAVVFRKGLEGWPTGERLDKALIVSFLVALTLSLTPLVVPMSGKLTPFPGAVVVSTSIPLLATFGWIVFLMAAAARGVIPRRAVPITSPSNREQTES